ncbi:MAG: phosphogluconate dehydratase [Pseudomonadota bacterium]
MSVALHPVIQEVTDRINDRSAESRQAYLEMVRFNRPETYARLRMTDGNLAHASAGCAVMDKAQLLGAGWPNIGIITAYNDMLSAHQPFETYPELIREAAREVNATAQVAGGVPAMCDGVTQSQDGMELSLFSRDVIALAAAVGLSHNVFDAAIYMGVCDKIVPGLVIAALRFGWIPAVFVPAGPMPSGLPNPEKARIRQAFARGEIGRDKLLAAEAASYHSPGTCTFYGTANSNQILMEAMGFHLPGTAFVAPGTDLREALTRASVHRAVEITAQTETYCPPGEMIDARSIVNATVSLMATGGSTNHMLHIPAMAAAAGLEITQRDMADISAVTPLLCRIYPNGTADVNHFHAAGGVGFLIRELMDAGLMHSDARTIAGSLADQVREPWLDKDKLAFRDPPAVSGDMEILRPIADPFSVEGGLSVLSGKLGSGIMKVSAVKPEHRTVRAPARVFDTQADVKRAFDAGELNSDVVIVIRFQGPSANGMPELHGLSPILGSLQDAGHAVALITDGRMSGASGKFPAAIHVTPEAARGGPIASIEDGDLLIVDGANGIIDVEITVEALAARPTAFLRPNSKPNTVGQDMFSIFRLTATDADAGGSLFRFLPDGSKAA